MYDITLSGDSYYIRQDQFITLSGNIYYIIRQPVNYIIRCCYCIIRQLLHYLAILLHYQAFITLTGDCSCIRTVPQQCQRYSSFIHGSEQRFLVWTCSDQHLFVSASGWILVQWSALSYLRYVNGSCSHLESSLSP